MTRKFLSLLAILYGLIYFFYESWYHLNFGQSVLNLSIDYLAIILLLAAGTVNLKEATAIWGLMRSLGLYRMPHDESLCLEARRGRLRNRRIQGHVFTHLRDCRIDCCICCFVDSVICAQPEMTINGPCEMKWTLHSEMNFKAYLTKSGLMVFGFCRAGSTNK